MSIKMDMIKPDDLNNHRFFGDPVKDRLMVQIAFD